MKATVLMLSLCVATTLAQAPSVDREPTGRSNPSIDPRATEALGRMTAFLKTVKTFTVSSESSRVEIVDTDMKVQKQTSNEVTVRLPDRLYAHVRGDEHDLQFFYDGRTLTVFSRDKNMYASTPAPPTVSRTLDATRVRHGISMPLADFIQMASADNVLDEILDAGYIGTSRVDGVECDHIAIRQRDVDWQVWLERSATPLPRRMVITTKTEPTQPQYIATFRWNLSPKFDDKLFVFTPPPNAARIAFARAKNREQIPDSPQ